MPWPAKIRSQTRFEALLEEDSTFRPLRFFSPNCLDQKMNRSYQEADENQESFWARQAEELEWMEPWGKVLELEPSRCPLVRRRQAQCERQLPRPAHPNLASQQGGHHLGR